MVKPLLQQTLLLFLPAPGYLNILWAAEVLRQMKNIYLRKAALPLDFIAT